jgi:hypothetical protein
MRQAALNRLFNVPIITLSSRDGVTRSCADRSRGHHGVLHPVEQFLIRRTDGGEAAPEFGFPVDDEVIRAQPDTAAHGLDLTRRRLEEGLIEEAAFVKLLKDVRVTFKLREGARDRRLPFDL